MSEKLWCWALRMLQKRCIHPPRNVAADILDGDAFGCEVAWCRLCGAYRRLGSKDYRVPRPDWEASK